MPAHHGPGTLPPSSLSTFHPMGSSGPCSSQLSGARGWRTTVSQAACHSDAFASGGVWAQALLPAAPAEGVGEFRGPEAPERTLRLQAVDLLKAGGGEVGG